MRLVLDACVLYPTVLREILADLAAEGLFRPVWSQRILGEWRLAAERNGLSAGVEIALLADRFPKACQPEANDARAEGLDLPDPADRHVVETALTSGADAILTANLRDFPPRALAAVGLRAIHPDEFLHGLYLNAPDSVARAVAMACRRAVQAGGAITRKDLLRRARLPRLAKALARFDDAE
ncbi:MAG: PIN domain-containing protein [Paracoccus sp. (in: a-proteobacteria)]|uniref:RSP_2648 family PIN domain-containing protein n=1 Tax=Paracoccus sp. TaxID=267 RepID=UPI0039E6A59B